MLSPDPLLRPDTTEILQDECLRTFNRDVYLPTPPFTSPPVPMDQLTISPLRSLVLSSHLKKDSPALSASSSRSPHSLRSSTTSTFVNEISLDDDVTVSPSAIVKRDRRHKSISPSLSSSSPPSMSIPLPLPALTVLSSSSAVTPLSPSSSLSALDSLPAITQLDDNGSNESHTPLPSERRERERGSEWRVTMGYMGESVYVLLALHLCLKLAAGNSFSNLKSITTSNVITWESVTLYDPVISSGSFVDENLASFFFHSFFFLTIMSSFLR